MFRPILSRLGLDKLRLVMCGGSSLPPETAALWQVWGINVVEIYGQTETAGGIITGQESPFPRPGNVGAAPAGWQVVLDEGSEITVEAPDLFDGLENAVTTAATLNEQQGNIDQALMASVGFGNTGADIFERGGPYLIRGAEDLIRPSEILDEYSPALFCTIRNFHDVEPKVAASLGGNGYSLKLRGLDRGLNDLAEARHIVMHGAWYVSPQHARHQGRLGRSWGCPALSEAVAPSVIDTIKGGTFLFAFASRAAGSLPKYAG